MPLRSSKTTILIYAPTVLSLVLLIIYITSMRSFYSGDIPGMEYVAAALAPFILIPFGLIYLIVTIVRRRRGKIDHFSAHLKSSIATICFSGAILMMMGAGYIVTV